MAFCVGHLSIACKDGSPLGDDSDESGTEEPARKRIKIEVIYPGAVGVRDDPYHAAELVDGADLSDVTGILSLLGQHKAVNKQIFLKNIYYTQE